MERAATAAFVNAVIGKIVNEIEKKYMIWRGLPRQSEELIRCLNTLVLGMDDELVKCGGAPRTAVARAYGQEMHALTHDIEDCLERFLHRVTSEIRALKRRLQNAGNRVFNPPGGSQASCTPTVPRYLIAIDGIKEIHMEHWDTIRSIFKGSGRVLLTTTFHSIANKCTNHSPQEISPSRSEMPFGYVCNMKTLSNEDSQKVSLPWRCSPELVHGSATLLEKCDGHPLALSCVASLLSYQDEPTGKFCMELYRNLGSFLTWDGTDEPNFSRLRGVLFDSFIGLQDHFVCTCMIYLGIFLVDNVLKRNVKIRRWCAEGYARNDPDEVSEQMVADRYFNFLVDRNIIQPVAPSSSSSVKMCRIHGLLYAFVLHKSVSEKFINMFDVERHGAVRHLVVRYSNTTNSGKTLRMDVSRARSLTVFGTGGCAISDFLKYKLIRVIDLEACTDLHDHHLEEICKLWNLRYLSLGPNISAIPKEIAKLKLLETLDISKTIVNVLPWVVIGLRRLSLQKLHFVVCQSNFTLPEVQEGALPHLVSLQLLCNSLAGMPNFEIKHLENRGVPEEEREEEFDREPEPEDQYREQELPEGFENGKSNLTL
uniref:Rx N-terminal domain-containing protein n=1 Tax=Setaria viridis TaxID=4556 RepID=A0A4U6V1F6_SETVI|nr:hypothetical protein SEVIR_4G208900v2 [Setaria viridis]